MKWKRIMKESSEGSTKSIPVELSIRELKLIQNYLNKGKPLNDPSNKECMEVVIRMLKEILDSSQIEQLDTYVSNFMFENFGIEVDVDPYGENTAIELGENGLVPISNCNNPNLDKDGPYGDMVQGGFWKEDGQLAEGFISVDDLNKILKEEQVGNGVDEIQLKQDGKIAKLLLTFK